MSSRLERTLYLIENAASIETRSAAAMLLGEIVKNQPEEALYIVNQLLPLTYSKTWETREAVAKAFSYITSNIGDANISNINQTVESALNVDPTCKFTISNEQELVSLLGMVENADYIDMNDLNTDHLISHVNYLMSAPVANYLTSNEALKGDQPQSSKSVKKGKNGVQAQSNFLSSKLSSIYGAKTSIELSEADLSSNKVFNNELSMDINVAKITVSSYCNKLSKSNLKNQYFNKPNELDLITSGNTKKIKHAQDITMAEQNCMDIYIYSVDKKIVILLNFIIHYLEKLKLTLYNEHWETRHGSLLVMNELIISLLHGDNLKKTVKDLSTHFPIFNNYLVDIISRIVVLVTIDRITDFSGERIVSPVRESGCKGIGYLSGLLPNENDIECISAHLLTMYAHTSWEIRHTSLMGIKYLISARQDLIGYFFDFFLPDLLITLNDEDDDVRAVCADAIIPIIQRIYTISVENNNEFKLFTESSARIHKLNAIIQQIFDILYNELRVQDELCVSTSNVMILLSNLILISDKFRLPLDIPLSRQLGLLSHLWPLLGHTSLLVRHETLKTFHAMLIHENCTLNQQSTLHLQSKKDSDNGNNTFLRVPSWIEFRISDVLCNLFILALTEKNNEIISLLSDVWRLSLLIINKYCLMRVSESLDAIFKSLFVILCTPVGEKQSFNMVYELIQNSHNDNEDIVLNNENEETNRCDYMNSLVLMFPTNQDEEGLLRLAGANLLADLFCTMLSDSVQDINIKLNVFETVIFKSNEYLYLMLGAIILSEIAGREKNIHVQGHLTSIMYPTFVSIIESKYVIPYHELVSLRRELHAKSSLICSQIVSLSTLSREIANMNDKALYDFYEVTVPTALSSSGISDESKLDELRYMSKQASGLAMYLLELSGLLSNRVMISVIELCIVIKCLPAKLNPVLHPLLDGIKKEPILVYQERFCSTLAKLLRFISDRPNSPNPRLVSNLLSVIDTSYELLPPMYNTTHLIPETDIIDNTKVKSILCEDASNRGSSSSPHKEVISAKDGIFTLIVIETGLDCDIKTGYKHKLVAINNNNNDNNQLDEGNKTEIEIRKMRRLYGAVTVIEQLAAQSGLCMYDEFPYLTTTLISGITCFLSTHDYNSPTDLLLSQVAGLVQKLVFLIILVPYLHETYVSDLIALYAALVRHLGYPSTCVRFYLVQLCERIAKRSINKAMEIVVTTVLPMLKLQSNSNIVDSNVKQGCIELLYTLVDSLGLSILPYSCFLLVPLISEVSSTMAKSSLTAQGVRILASTTFSQVLKILPLEQLANNPVDMAPELIEAKRVQRLFISRLLDHDKLTGDTSLDKEEKDGSNSKKTDEWDRPSYFLNPEIKLRRYQIEGFRWLCFLSDFGLHGILADDMGLGKTLQAIMILIRSICKHEREEATDNNEGRTISSLKINSTKTKRFSMVVCPSILLQHWADEIVKFSAHSIEVVLYAGTSKERESIRKSMLITNPTLACGGVSPAYRTRIIVTSYESIRADYMFFGDGVELDYVVLDEGHIIRNARSKVSIAVKSLSCRQRLILTGTPIQNNIDEMWSLFDFLMPGLLGNEAQFNKKYSISKKLSVNKRNAMLTEKDILRLDKLHKQLLPFILRRTKQKVLLELPPKVMQDIYCELTPLQLELYENFDVPDDSRTKDKMLMQLANHNDNEMVGESEDGGGGAGIDDTMGKGSFFKTIFYLRKLVTHPALVLTKTHPKYTAATTKYGDIRSIVHSNKLLILKELLHECGIGQAQISSNTRPLYRTNEKGMVVDDNGDEEEVTGGGLIRHKILIFCQFKDMVDIIIDELLVKHLPTARYLRLDGSIPVSQRGKVASQFNGDRKMDILLLTTHVGGLGLNLTSADTVIFVEHDWNPMKDLQAMDRAHRIGQKNSVAVYRLITRNTAEEKLMNLQRLKTFIANTVVSTQNTATDNFTSAMVLSSLENAHQVTIPKKANPHSDQ